jgi:serine/threonine protein kinase, bacterial
LTKPGRKQLADPFAFAGRHGTPVGLAVDGAADLYIAGFIEYRVVKVAAGKDNSTLLPFIGLDRPDGVAVDRTGNVYVAGRYNDRVLKLAREATTRTVIPLTGLRDLKGVAVDGAGNV